MADYISREAVLADLSAAAEKGGMGQIIADTLMRYVKRQPAADVEPVRYGQWESCFEDYRQQIEGNKCSACGFEYYGTGVLYFNFCPGCGTKMDGGE